MKEKFDKILAEIPKAFQIVKQCAADASQQLNIFKAKLQQKKESQNATPTVDAPNAPESKEEPKKPTP